MTAPVPTMKTIQKRIHTVLPRAVSASSASSSPISRARATSATSRYFYTGPSSTLPTNALPLSFFDYPPLPPPSSRPGNPHVLSTTRLPVQPQGEGESHANAPGQHPSHPAGSLPFSLALTSPQTNSSSSPQSSYQSSFFPYSSFNISPFCCSCPTPSSDPQLSLKRQRVRYQLDVGAYGIPKSCRGVGHDARRNPPFGNTRWLQSQRNDETSLAVPVGEDAYFIRDDALGVADGVGGWAKAKNADPSPPKNPNPPISPSALFAQRLMHYCSSEVDTSSQRCHPPFLSSPVSPEVTPLFTKTKFNRPNYIWSAEADELQEELESSLEDLEEGLNVLMILERAYEKTIKAHVIHPNEPSSLYMTSAAISPIVVPTSPTTSISPPTSPFPFSSSFSRIPMSRSSTPNDSIPLAAGSSTALLAVLDHVHHQASNTDKGSSKSSSYDAVIKIAHIGDCMGMLVRGEEMVWRSEEMWWSFNTPVQLGPSSSALPHDAQVFTLPVAADDILILASDGLSDNLWDEDVLDEVIRFRRSFLDDSTSCISVKCPAEGLLRRRTLAGMLSEALCSRARRVSEKRGSTFGDGITNEVPFARRARENGRTFRGGKSDDISVIVAVISEASDF